MPITALCVRGRRPLWPPAMLTVFFLRLFAATAVCESRNGWRPLTVAMNTRRRDEA